MTYALDPFVASLLRVTDKGGVHPEHSRREGRERTRAGLRIPKLPWRQHTDSL